MTPAQIKAYRIADNKTAELSDWNYDLLVQELADLQQQDFDLHLVGSSSEELQDPLPTQFDDELSDPDLIPEPPEETTSLPESASYNRFG